MPENRISDVNSYAPSVLDHVIGQPQAVERVKVALEACWNDGTRFPHTLMVGPPGVGKSLLARVIAAEMGCPELRETLGQTLSTPFAVHAFLLEPHERDLIFIDEADECSQRAQTMLYRALEDRKVFVPQHGSGKSRSVPLVNFTVLGATNHEFSLVKPLRDRFRLILRFDYYCQAELAALLRQRARALRWQVEDDVLELIAERGRGTPRIALRLLESCWRTARSVNASVIMVEHFERTCRLEGLDRLGLGQTERKYLRILAETLGPVRLNILAMRLGVPARSLSEVTEPFLVRSGLMAKSDDGRQLTPKGMEHLRTAEEEQ